MWAWLLSQRARNNVFVVKAKRLSKMSIHKYFKPEKSPLLPDPAGPLSAVVPSSTIEEANKAVKRVLDEEAERNSKRARQGYDIFTAQEKAALLPYCFTVSLFSRAITPNRKIFFREIFVIFRFANI